MTDKFDDWWNEDDLTTSGNNFVEGTPAYWAWEGWCAGVKACAKVCDEQMQGKSMWVEGARACVSAIRAMGEKK